MTTLVVEGRKVDAEVWQKLRAGLDAITSLPSPLDTAAIVRVPDWSVRVRADD